MEIRRMIERCPSCAHTESLLENEQKRHLAASQLYMTYYRQCTAQEKGIRRLRRLIARLREEGAK